MLDFNPSPGILPTKIPRPSPFPTLRTRGNGYRVRNASPLLEPKDTDESVHATQDVALEPVALGHIWIIWLPLKGTEFAGNFYPNPNMATGKCPIHKWLFHCRLGDFLAMLSCWITGDFFGQFWGLGMAAWWSLENHQNHHPKYGLALTKTSRTTM